MHSKLVFWGWTVFIGENILMSHNRTEIINAVGDQNYHRIYNTLSTISCGSIILGFARGRRKGELVSNLFPKWFGFCQTPMARLLKNTCKILGLGIASQALPKLQLPWEMTKDKANNGIVVKSKCPIDFATPEGMAGVKRITRHPMLWSLGLYSLSFAFSATYITQLVFFAYPMVFTIIGGLHQDYRHQRNIGGSLTPTDEQMSSFLPFGALFKGSLTITEMVRDCKGLNLLIALCLAAL